mgnify:CR=1 FL=1
MRKRPTAQAIYQGKGNFLLLIYRQRYYGGALCLELCLLSLQELTSACISAVSLTCKEKVIKVFTVSLQLMNLVVSSQKVEKEGASEVLKNTIVEKNVVLKLLQKSEEGNTRMTNKIHESLLDLSFNPEIGEALASSFILQRI